MGFTKLTLKPEYRSYQDNIVKEFYVPVLNKAISYKRAVGFFSSTALIEITKGLSGLIKNNGKIKIIASPQLSIQDIEAINEGYKSREQVVQENILSNLDLDIKGFFDKKRLNLLAHLIKYNFLDIKIAFIENEHGIGIYHEKIGIVEDRYNNKIVFTGSLNETQTGLSYNYESFDVFCSWENEEERVVAKETAFDELWNNMISQVKTYEFPKVAKEKLEKYIFEEPDYNIDEKEELLKENKEVYSINKPNEIVGPRIPDVINLREYQKEAINNWREKGYRGIFDMATGTGKTITGLAAATKLFENNNRLSIIIVCPYQHLVDQWVEDIELFNMRPIIGYSKSKQKKWRNVLQTSIDAFNMNLTNHFCFVTTNATFSTESVQNRLKRIKSNLLLIVDEAHNFGARHYAKSLLRNAQYRLALSATIDRHNDEEGTALLYNYFGEKCIEYNLEDAIKNRMLTPYEYYPIPIYLDEEEIEEYKRLTTEIGKRIYKDKNGKVKFSESAKHFLLQRARLIAGVKNKLVALKNEIEKRKDGSHMLVYCGATTVNDVDYIDGSPEETEIRQIDAVSKMLGNDLGMYVAQFTSKEDSKDRDDLIERFSNNDHLQVLVAIRCLDEGVNIPSVKIAYLLASSTNPKEYIQRRGRVLRLYEGKSKAIIYDFITLPAPIKELKNYSEEELNTFKGLINREVIRMKDFSGIALNPSEADFLIFDLENIFRFNSKEVTDENEQFI